MNYAVIIAIIIIIGIALLLTRKRRLR